MRARPVTQLLGVMMLRFVKLTALPLLLILWLVMGVSLFIALPVTVAYAFIGGYLSARV